MSEPPLLSVRDLAKTLPRPARLADPEDRAGARARRRIAGGRRGRSARRCRRKRLRQIDVRAACVLRLAAGRRRIGRIRRPGRARGLAARASARCAGSMQMVFQDPDASLEPASAHRRGDRRAAPRAWRSHRAAAVRSSVARLLDEVGLPRERARSLPARVLRRPAPAHRHRPRAGARPDLIFADEPVSALDVSVQAQILRLLERCAAIATSPSCSSRTISGWYDISVSASR